MTNAAQGSGLLSQWAPGLSPAQMEKNKWDLLALDVAIFKEEFVF